MKTLSLNNTETRRSTHIVWRPGQKPQVVIEKHHIVWEGDRVQYPRIVQSFTK